MQQPVLLLPKFRVKYFHSVIKVTVVFGIACLACQDEFYMNIPLDVREDDEHAVPVSSKKKRDELNIKFRKMY
jgi:hypothetical protein